MSDSITPESLNTLEEIMVKEFRVCQTLQSLTKDERVALSSNDASQLLALVEKKEATLDELGQIDEARRMIVQEIGSGLGLPSSSPTVADILRVLDADYARRLKHLHEGIVALMNDVRDLTHGNRTLAKVALERSDAVQAFLLSLFDVPTGYKPPTIPTTRQSSIAWELDKAA